MWRTKSGVSFTELSLELNYHHARVVARIKKSWHPQSCLPLFRSHVSLFLSKTVNMSNVVSEKPNSPQELEEQPKAGPVYDVGEKTDFDRAGAINAEDIEHNMTVLEAVKAYPAASCWAFVMTCTIVSFCP